MTQTCTVLVGAADRLPRLKARVNQSDGELLDFLDVDPLRALEAIVKRRPRVIALERLFAASPRGAALINRVKGDRNLVDTEIRVLAHDSEYMRVVPRPSSAAAQAVDQRGTRRAPRFKMAPKVMALVDGKHATLVDLSTIGAQIVSPAALKPNQMNPLGPDFLGRTRKAPIIGSLAINVRASGGAGFVQREPFLRLFYAVVVELMVHPPVAQ